MAAKTNPPRRIAQTPITSFLLILSMILLVILGMARLLPLRAQDSPRDGILILIDRPPNTLDPRQAPDAMARRILPLILESGYRPEPAASMEEFELKPPNKGAPPLRFRVVRDDLNRGVLFERGEADVLLNGLSLSKTAYFRKKGWPVLTPPGHHLSYLGFDLRNRILAVPAVRQAVRVALPVDLWARHKYFDLVEPDPLHAAGPDWKRSESLLDQAGFPRALDGWRFSLRYLTTPVREGNELAFLVREALKAVGIRVEVVPLESSLFFSRLKRGDFDLFGSRILRSRGDSPVGELFRSGSPRNFFDYSSPALDRLLESRPEAPWEELWPRIERDPPLIPLFRWRHGILLSRRLQWRGGATPFEFDDSFRFLPLLQIK